MDPVSATAGGLVPFEEMSTDEQIQHVQALWDIIAARAEEVAITPEQRAEVQRRLSAHRADPDAARPWHEVRAAIEKSTP